MMVHFRMFPSSLASIFIALVGFSSAALSAQPSSAESSKNARTVPAPLTPRPFSFDTTHRTSVYRIEFRSEDQITAKDRLLIANVESSIAEKARSAGIDYGSGTPTYHEIICPSFTNHLFLRFGRDHGSGDVTVFTASIPRNGEGSVRVVPILKRSYSLFSPAPINAMTISAFNHIRAEEGQAVNSDWLANALCYAALAGAEPQVVTSDAAGTPHTRIPSATAMMEVGTNGREIIRFVDVAAHPHAMEWTMTFARSGKLTKAAHKPAEILRAKPIPQKSSVASSTQIAQPHER